MRYQEPRKRLRCVLSWNGSQVERRCSSLRQTAQALGEEYEVKDKKNVGNDNFLEEKLEQLAIKKKKSITYSNLTTWIISVTKRHLSLCRINKLDWAPRRNCRYSLPFISLYTCFKIYVPVLKFLPEQGYYITKSKFHIQLQQNRTEQNRK